MSGKKELILIGLIILTIPISSILGDFLTQSLPKKYFYNQLLPVNIITSKGNFSEKAVTSSDEILKGKILSVRFYHLNRSKTYYIELSKNGRIREFRGIREITIHIYAKNYNWCYLGVVTGRDLIWIWIGNWNMTLIGG